ncbi:thioester-forming surface-anchored protein, partial [Helcococcus ovis]
MKEKLKKLVSFMFVIFLLAPYVSTSFAMETTENSQSSEKLNDVYDWQGYSEKDTGIIKVKKNDSISYNAYCFNKEKSLPPSDNSEKIIYKKIDGSGDVFTQYASKARIQNQELNDRILSIIYNGYPTNANKILDGLSDADANTVTQAAIWYYTDSEENKGFWTILDREYRKKAEEAYKKLISDNLERDVQNKRPENFKLNLFVTNQKNEKKNKEYQNLLSAEHVPNDPPKKIESKKYITVMKIWSGIETGSETPKVSFQLFKGNEKIGTPKEFNGDQIIFEVDATSNGVDTENNNYTVKEVVAEKEIEEGETAKIDGNLYKVNYEGDAEKGFKVINKKITEWLPLEPAKTKVSVEKKWQNYEGKDINPTVDKIKVRLYSDGNKREEVLELNSENNWKGEFKDLPNTSRLTGEKYNYTVKEEGESEKQINLDNKWFDVTYDGNMEDGFTIVNKEKRSWVPIIPPIREIKVAKEWKDYKGDNLDNIPVEEIQVQLYKDGVKEGEIQKLSKENNWKYTFKNLKDYEKLGKEIKKHIYTIKEIHNEKELENGESTKFNGKWYGVSYTGNMKDGFTITNKEKAPWTPMIPPTRNIKVTKNWKLLTAEKPVDKIEVELYKDGVATGKKLVLTKDNNWIGEFKNLEVANGLGNINYHKYTVKEV